MNYVQILSCSGDLGNCCNDTSVALLLDSFRRVMDFIQLATPIILLIFASIEFFKLVTNPEKKDGLKRVKNMFLAAAIVFFVPVLVNALISIMPQTFSLSACWQQTRVIAEENQQVEVEYENIEENQSTSVILPDPDDFERGVPAQDTSSSSSTPTVAPSGNASASAQRVIEGAKTVHSMYEQNGWAYYDSLDELTWGNINYSTNNPSLRTCCATFVGSAFYVAGIFSEEVINQYNYNSQYGIDELCSDHGWIRIDSYSQLAPGDVVIMSGVGGGDSPEHVQIYAGSGTWYNAGSTQAIQRSNPYPIDSSSRFLHAWRIP